MKKVSFELTLYDDECVKKKMEVLNKMECMWDDLRNPDPQDYFELIENLPFGSTIRITVEVL